MARGQVDILDLPFFAAFLLGSLLALGIIPSMEVPYLGWDLASAFYTLEYAGETVDFSIPMLLSLGGLIGAAATNKWTMSGATGVQIYAVIATVILIVAPPFVPMLDALLGASLAGFVVLFVQSWGFVVVSYLG